MQIHNCTQIYIEIHKHIYQNTTTATMTGIAAATCCLGKREHLAKAYTVCLKICYTKAMPSIMNAPSTLSSLQ